MMIMIMNSSYNETLSGETLSSMSEKSDSYFTTELDSRCDNDVMMCNVTMMMMMMMTMMRKMK